MKFRKTKENLPFLILSLILVCLIFAVVVKETGLFAAATSNDGGAAVATSDHYITIYDNNQKLTVRSNAATVREALERANVHTEDADTVEPGLDEPINEENFNINIYRARSVMVLDDQTIKYVNMYHTI